MNYLKKKLQERNISQNELAKRIGITKGRVSQLTKEGKDLSKMPISRIYEISRVLDLDLKEFVEEILE